ncbi:MAG: DUF2157 domain-containing protein [Acidimicrobiia bacterium]|nr:DUF2157 domain-containing protein [Acidimicrobiia bacterium]
MRASLIPILIIVVAVVAGFFVWQRRHGGEAGRVGGKRPAAVVAPEPRGDPGRFILGAPVPGPGRWTADLSRWVSAGLISADQAAAIAHFEESGIGGRSAPIERRVSLLAEALGYVGMVLALAGAAAGLAQGWEDLPVWARLVIPAAVTGLLLLGGVFLRHQDEPAFRRLMSVLWVLTVGGLAWTLAVIGAEFTDWDAEPIALMVGGGCTLLAGTLYLIRRHGLQQVALLASGHALVVSGLVALPGQRHPGWWFAVAVWVLGAAWAALGWKGLLPPGWLAVALGFMGMVIAPAIGVGEYDWLLAPALLTAAGLVALSVPTHQTPLLALGMVGAFGYITWAVTNYFQDSLGAPVALVVVGAVFLAMAVLAGGLAQRNKGKPARSPE